MLAKIAENFYRIIIFLAAFAIVVYMSIRLRIWSADFTMVSIMTGDWGTIIFVTLVVAAAGIALTKLLQWEVRAETRPRKRYRR